MQAIGPYHFHNASTSMSLSKLQTIVWQRALTKKLLKNHVSTDNVWLQT